MYKHKHIRARKLLESIEISASCPTSWYVHLVGRYGSKIWHTLFKTLHGSAQGCFCSALPVGQWPMVTPHSTGYNSYIINKSISMLLTLEWKAGTIAA